MAESGVTFFAAAIFSPGIAVLAFFVLIGIVFLGSLVFVPVQQRNDARAAAADAQAEQRTREEFELVEKELSIACIEVEGFFADTLVEQEEATEPWKDWQVKTAVFLCLTLGEAAEARFRGTGESHSSLRLWAVRDREQLVQLMEEFTPERIRLAKPEIEAAINDRRENEGLALIARRTAAEANRKMQQEEHARQKSEP